MKDENSFTKSRLIIFPVCLALLTFLIIIIFFTQNDFWQDELYAMNHFVFVPAQTIFTDYHSTNNHILFDLTTKLYAAIFGIGNACDALQHPILIRKLPMLFTLFSIIYFYFQSGKIDGKNFSLVALSILCSTMVFANFAVQLRGYSLSLLLTIIQFFSFLKITRDDKRSGSNYLLLFLSTALNLLCLPSSIYFSTALLFLGLILFSPAISDFFFNRQIGKPTVIKLLLCLVIAILPAIFYYQWLMQHHPENDLMTTHRFFAGKNLLQALAVVYHFTDYRIYFFVFIGIYFYKRMKHWSNYSAANFPLFCFFFPFVLYFIHGPVIVQRIFVPLIPIFAVAMTWIIQDIFSSQKNQRWVYFLLTANWLCLVAGYVHLDFRSKKDNFKSYHQQDLLNHYYLVNYNSQQVAEITKNLQNQHPGRIFVLDDFGETGIKYYLRCAGVTFENYSGLALLKKNDIVITNNKVKVESELSGSQMRYSRSFAGDKQYQLYQIN